MIFAHRNVVPFTFAAVVAFAGVASGCTPAEETESSQPVKTETVIPPFTRTSLDFNLPDFSLVTASGDSITADGLKGKVTVINFWATWCAPCVVEIPELVVLYDDWKDRNFEIIGVAMDDEGFDLVTPFADNFAINYPVVLDNGALADDFGGVYGLPTSFVIDENGRVKDRFIGVFPVSVLREELDTMIRRTE